MTDYPGRAERQTARGLVDRLPRRIRRLAAYGGADLAATIEHVLYTAIRHPQAHPAPSTGGALARTIGRLGVALRETVTTASPRQHGGLAVLVTQPVHVRVFEPIGSQLVAMGEPRPLVVVARTGVASHDELQELADLDLRGSLPVTALAGVARYAVNVAATVRTPPPPWLELVGRTEAERLLRVVRAALPRLALDVARLDGFITAARPRAIACFSEAGILARVVPAVAATHGVPSADLPHAEAADPWGSAGMGYDAIGVYGPRAASVLRLAGIPANRITTLGPLPYDALIEGSAAAAEGSPASDGVRRVLFASQPVDPARPHLAEPVKRLALEAAVAVAAAVTPAELVVLPHPTEARGELDRLIGSIEVPDGVTVLVDQPGRLHARLSGAFALVTASSQSVFEAVVATVPAIAVHPAGMPAPVTFVDEGIALGVDSPDAAARLAGRLSDLTERSAVVDAARRVLDDRIGPLDGRAAERAARWLHDLGR